MAGLVATVSLIAQNVGTLPQAVFAADNPQALSSTTSVNFPEGPQILGADPVGTSQVMVRMPTFTRPDAARSLGETYGMRLIGSYPAFGSYLFDLPKIQVEPATTPDTALVYFPPRTSPSQITSYLADNQLKVEHWYLSHDAGETPERIALVVLPRVSPVVVDGPRGIWGATLPAHIDATRLSDWATASGVSIVSYDPSTGALLLNGPVILPPTYVPPVVTYTPHVAAPSVVTTPAPRPTPVVQPAPPQLFVTFATGTTPAAALAAIQQVGGQLVSFDPVTDVAVVNVTSGNQTALMTLLSALTSVQCVNPSVGSCNPAPLATPASTNTTTPTTTAPTTTTPITPTPAPTAAPVQPVTAPVALQIQPDTGALSGTVRLSADIQSADSSVQVEWALSGALASTTIGTSAAAHLTTDPLTWSATVNFDSTTVPDGAYTLSIRIQDGSGNVTLVNRSVTVGNAKPEKPTGFAAAAVPAGIALTWQQPAVGDAALYRLSRDGVQIAELSADSRSYLDTAAAAGPHTYQLVLVNRFGNASDPVATDMTVAAAVTENSVTFRVLLPGGDQLAADGLAGGHLILTASAVQPSTPIAFQYTADGASWSTVPAPVSCSAKCTADWNLNGLTPGHYRLRAIAGQPGAQVMSEEVGFIVAAATALPAPTALVATATSWGVDLHWTPPAGLAPPAYLISRQTPSGWSPLARSSTLDYTDGSVVPGESYSYRVQAIGSDGTAGTPSDSASISIRSTASSAGAPAPSLPAPTGLRVVDGPGGATLLWQPVPLATGYVVERALDSAGTFQSLPAVATPMFRDSAQRIGGQVFYRVRAIGPGGVGAPSAVVAGLVMPGPAAATTAPFVVAPSGSAPAGTTGDLELGGNQTAPVRAGNSVIVHATGSTAGVDRTDLQKLVGTSWITLMTLSPTVTPVGWSVAGSIDLSGVGAGDLTLRVAAESAGGETLAVTAPGAVQVVHSAPIPTGLRASSSGTSIHLSWAAPSSGAPLTYSVFRASGVGGYSLAASGLTAPAFDDPFLVGSLAVSYVVTATDDLGNQSLWSAPAGLTTPAAWSQSAPTVQFVLPSTATLAAGDTALVAAAGGGSGGITSFSFAYSLQGSTLWIDIPDRFPVALDGPTLIGLGDMAVWAARFKTTGLATGTYSVRARETDSLGHTTEVVRALTVAVSPSRGPPAADFTLNATASVGAVHLSWNAAGGPYQVERSTDGASGPFEAIGTTTSNSFDDHLLIPGFAYAYRVIGLGAGATTSSTAIAIPLAAPSSGITSPDQQLNVVLPATTAWGLNLSITPAPLTQSMQAGLGAFGSAYEINATSLGSGAQVHLLEQAATLTFTLPQGISAAQAAGLAVFHWDAALGAWKVEPSTLDLATGRITATVNHFSTFTVAAALSAIGTPIATTEGATFAGEVATFTDSNPGLPAGAFTATIDWGDRSVLDSGAIALIGPGSFSVIGSHAYLEEGGYPVLVAITDFAGNAAAAATAAAVADAPISSSNPGNPVTAIQGVSFTAVVATFVDTNPNAAIGDWFAVIYWGDGTSSSGAVGQVDPQTFDISGTHTYLIAGTFTYTVDFADVGGSAGQVTGSATVIPAMVVTSSSVQATEGVLFSGAVATFTSSIPNPTLIQFTATITWGDGTTSQGTVAANGTGFDVTGSHSYAEEGTFTTSVDVQTGLVHSSAIGTATVGDAALTASAVNVAATEGAAFNGVVATFADANLDGTVSDFTATINWGDSTTSTGIVIANGAGAFTVNGTHTYGEEGSYAVLVTVNDVGGSSASASSTATVTDAALTASAVSVVATEGAAFSGAVATFTDANPNGNVSDFTATINWGDNTSSTGTVTANSQGGFTVAGTHTYAEEGSYIVSVTVNDVGGSSATVISAATVGDAALTASALNVAATEGAAFNGSVATFADDNPNGNVSDFTATINWGDNTSSTGTVTADSQGGFTVAGTHTYAEEGSYIVSVTVNDVGGSSATVSSAATVGDAALTASAVNVAATEGATFSGAVATFTDANPNGNVSDFTATINWGDNTSSTGTVTANSQGGFTVNGTHTYGEEGGYAVSVTVNDVGGSSASATSAAAVADAALTASAVNVAATEGAAFSGAVATFTDANPNGNVSDFTATISWGDNTSSPGTVTANSQGGFTVTGTHSYAEEGSYRLSTTINDVGGSAVSASSAVNVADAALTASAMNVAAVVGAAFTGAVATFTDANPNGTVSDFTATINWGDNTSSTGIVTANGAGGFTVSGTHAYGGGGSYTVLVTVNDVGGSSASANSTATVAGAAITVSAMNVAATEGAAFNSAVATFIDANPNGTASDFTATINWGDNISSTGTVAANSSGGFTVIGAHTYGEESTYQLAVTVSDAGGSSATTSSSVLVADANLSARGFALPATRFTAFANIVAVFTDADPGGVASDYTAAINWGDGATSIGVVTAMGTSFAVTGSHTFGEGRFTITTSIADAGGASAVATSTITVDLTPPVTTATVNGTFDDGWWRVNGLGILTLVATDNLTGVVATYFMINGGSPQLYTGPISLSHGRYVITFWSVDGVGNVETAHTILIKVSGGHVHEFRHSEDESEVEVEGIDFGASDDTALAD